jgi:hypothetical protein
VRGTQDSSPCNAEHTLVLVAHLVKMKWSRRAPATTRGNTEVFMRLQRSTARGARMSMIDLVVPIQIIVPILIGRSAFAADARRVCTDRNSYLYANICRSHTSINTMQQGHDISVKMYHCPVTLTSFILSSISRCKQSVEVFQ